MSPQEFRYSENIANRFPHISAEVLNVAVFLNDQPSPGLASEFRAAQAEAVASLVRLAPGERATIKAWRSVFTAFGVKPTRHRNAAEALLRRLQRHGDIPSISPAVDIGNLISIRHSLPVAVFDLDRIEVPLTVSIANGSETFTGIGATVERPAEGEVVFVDATGLVAARRWCWRQSADAATQSATTSVLFVIEAAHGDRAAAVRVAADDLADLITRHIPEARTRRTSVSIGGDGTSDESSVS